MSHRKFPVTVRHGRPRSYGSIEEVLLDARGHARNRLLHACEAIAWVGGLALQWSKPHVPVFSLEGAAVQDATAGAGEQAAHVLPGQLLIDGNPPWALARGQEMKVAWLARFMATSAVPVAFNTADSAAEAAGLKEAFRDACQRSWTRAIAGERDLTATFERFLSDADRAFRRAEHDKGARRAAAWSKGKQDASDDRFVEGLMLRMYAMHGVTAREASRLFPLSTPTR
jgi:hypothetical protein